MTNFNTNQTRQFYVAGAVNAKVDTNLDIALAVAQTGEMYLKYRNADGLLSRSDTFDPNKIFNLKKTAASAMARKLMAHTIAVDTNAVTLSELVGKTLTLTITIHGFVGYDESDSVSYAIALDCNSANTASATAFHKALAIAIAKGIPTPDPLFPMIRIFSSGKEVTKDTKESEVTGAAAGVVLVEGVQKYVRGKLSGEPTPFSVAFRYAPSNVEDIVWGTDTVAASAISGFETMPANYILADLEYFALGERGDMFRGSVWPNDRPITYAIDPTGKTQYDVLTIEYYWSGNAENVQKSPRMIQVAGPNAVIEALYTAIDEKNATQNLRGTGVQVAAAPQQESTKK